MISIRSLPLICEVKLSDNANLHCYVDVLDNGLPALVWILVIYVVRNVMYYLFHVGL